MPTSARHRPRPAAEFDHIVISGANLKFGTVQGQGMTNALAEDIADQVLLLLRNTFATG
ncbi:MAG TPA: hypothetical protein VMV33_04735 [Rhodocyclaceae bacterium]|nr:hypothetical protein [Rhodocyclaceae bacterium]